MIVESVAGHLPKILIIDDEIAIRRFLRTVLSSEEFLLYEAENAHVGLSVTATVRPDVILLDLGLPDLGACRTYLLTANQT
jgi:two-component system KDP operon response regulator KdpE